MELIKLFLTGNPNPKPPQTDPATRHEMKQPKQPVPTDPLDPPEPPHIPGFDGLPLFILPIDLISPRRQCVTPGSMNCYT
jgi:hypothetical protein